jgi:hypothetical protein
MFIDVAIKVENADVVIIVLGVVFELECLRQITAEPGLTKSIESVYNILG